MKMIEVWTSYPQATQKQIATAHRVTAELIEKGVKAEIRTNGEEVSVWRDDKFVKNLRDLDLT